MWIRCRPSERCSVGRKQVSKVFGCHVFISPCTYPCDVSVGLVRQYKLRVALSCVARAGITTVHPVHEVAGAVPDGEDEDHATLKGVTHDWQTAKTLGFSCCGVAVVSSDAVKARPCGRVSNSVRDNSAFLHVRALNVDEGTSCRAIVSDEACGYRELLCGVDNERRSGSVVALLAQSVRVEATSPLVTNSSEAASLWGIAALDARNIAGVRSEPSCASVGLPDIHLVATGSQIVVVESTIEPLKLRALRITVARTVRRTRVRGALAASHGHLGKVQGAVHATRKGRKLNIPGKLLAIELYIFVCLSSGVEKVNSWRCSVVPTIAVRDILVEGDSISRSADTGFGVVNTLDNTVLAA
jgi:hypothetical protein